MKKILIIALLFFFKEVQSQEFLNNVGRNSMRTETTIATGTVVYVHNLYAVTTRHGLENKLGSVLELEFPKDTLGGIVVFQSQEHDISLIKLIRTPKGAIELNLKQKDNKPQEAILIGYPYEIDGKKDIKGIRSIIHCKIFLETEQVSFINYKATAGFSGGGIFTKNGLLLGILLASVPNNEKNRKAIKKLGGVPQKNMSMYQKTPYIHTLINEFIKNKKMLD